MRKEPIDFQTKLNAVLDILLKRLSIEEAAKRFDRSKLTISVWVKSYRHDVVQDLYSENQELKRQLTRLKEERLLFLDTPTLVDDSGISRNG